MMCYDEREVSNMTKLLFYLYINLLFIRSDREV
jgi:hypothetical protein